MGHRFGKIFEFIVGIFMCVLYAAMLAGAGAMLKQVYNLPFTLGVLIASGLTFIALLFDIKGLVAFNARLAPFLIAGGLMMGFLAFLDDSRQVFLRAMPSWLFSAIIYSSYNIVTAISVLAAMNTMLKSRGDAAKAGLISGGLLTLIGFCMVYPLYLRFNDVKASEIPLLIIAREYGSIVQYIYLFLLVAAILTTAVSNGFTVVSWLKSFSIKPLTAKLILAVGGVLAAHMGFSIIVARVYPLFSFVGLFEVVLIFFVWKSARKT
jgi:uncharacterized membrane protein YkvI